MIFQRKLPADPTSLVLGAVSLGIIFMGCCAWILAVIIWLVALVMSIIGLVMANKSARDYAADPESYYYKSINNVRNGKIVCIIAIVISSLALLVSIVLLVFIGRNFSEEIFKKYQNRNEQYYETTVDSSIIIDENEQLDNPVTDTISIDTIKIE